MSTIPAAALLLVSAALAAWSYDGIVRRYRRLSGFPWFHSLVFAAAATAAVFALRALLAV
jgi:hypothetical protein